MRWSNVVLIFKREVLDQLRDRRTLFMIFVFPIVLYPLLGFGVTKMSEAFEQKPRTIAIVGAEHLPEDPPLLSEDQSGFHLSLFDSPEEAGRLIPQVVSNELAARLKQPKTALEALTSGLFDAIVVVPDDIRDQIERIQKPTLEIFYDRRDEQSQTTYLRLRDLLDRWEEEIVARRLVADAKPAEYTQPVDVEGVDLASTAGPVTGAGSVWARILPFLLVMMSLTGAFYPAVDLCAGEKERGTMETLLISPASRSEIVFGKFFTVMLASMASALLNLASMGLTMTLIMRQVGSGGTAGPSELAAFQPPSFGSLVWMLILLIPLSVFFSALCLALAVMARSMKEGQYYMTPLYLVALPLIMLTLMPGVELSPFYCLVPITGVSLLLKALISGQLEDARTYFFPVLITTISYAALALRWAVTQFQSESVLFRESERFDLKDYLRHLVRDRQPLPTTGMAITCFLTTLILAWYTSLLIAGASPLQGMVLGHLIFILGPPLLFAFLLTSSPRRTLRLQWSGWSYLALGVALAVVMQPLIAELRPWVEWVFPIRRDLAEAIQSLVSDITLPTALLLFAVMPAITEEVAFRGFILSGLQTSHTRGSAVAVSAVLFGLMHVMISLVQQFFNATILGLVLGWLAIKSRSLFPGVLFHGLSNGLAVLTGVLLARPAMQTSLAWLYRDPTEGLYQRHWVGLAAVLTLALLVVLARIPSRPEPESIPNDTEAAREVSAEVPAGASSV